MVWTLILSWSKVLKCLQRVSEVKKSRGWQGKRSKSNESVTTHLSSEKVLQYKYV